MGHPLHLARSTSRRLRRPLLALLAAGALAPAVGGGCVSGFDPSSKVNALRILAVVADKPYANPGDTVTFTMTYEDGLPPPDQGPRDVQIVWLGGCFDPSGDQYYECYDQFEELFKDFSSAEFDPLTCVGPEAACCTPSDTKYLCAGLNDTEYTLKLPEDLVSQRPPPDVGPYYGIAYVFFAVCAGHIQQVTDEGGGEAGSFPLGCFDDEGHRLGSDSFVPGYTQVYAFEDGRSNQNPESQGLMLDGKPLPEDFSAIPTVKRCELTEDERRVSGCGKEDPFDACTSYNVEVMVDPSVAEIDPDSTGEEGEHLTEVVWVDYFADQGDFETGIKLVNDAVEGFSDENEVQWIPPSEPGIVTLSAVLHDARGGSAIVQRLVRVE